MGVSQIPCFFAPSGRRCPLDRRNTRRRPLRTCRPGTGLLNDIYTYPATNDRLQPIALGAGGTCSFTYDAAGNVTYDNRSGQGYGYTYDNAGRMASFSLGGVVQAEHAYNQLGQQIIRRLTQTGVTIHSVYGPDGNRIAEYNEATGALIRQYIWLEGAPIAVVEGGVVSFVRSDHIGRPVFATDSSGVKVWTAAYLPFGGVRVTTGTPPTARFPGQWFQSETGLHQNWMRDYDPTTGRYMQADPLGLVDGASVYGYARQSPGRYVDPRGEDTLTFGSLDLLPPRTGPQSTALGITGIGSRGILGALALILTPTAVGIGSEHFEGSCGTEDCTSLYNQISAVVSELEDRRLEYHLDAGGLPETGRMSRAGHRQQFRDKQTMLRRLLTTANSRGCTNYRPDAWHWATRPIAF